MNETKKVPTLMQLTFSSRKADNLKKSELDDFSSKDSGIKTRVRYNAE